MNINESNQVGKTTPTNPQENGAEKTEQKPQNPPSVWLHDNGDGYFQVTDLAGIVEENEITLYDGQKMTEKVDVKREFIKEFGTKLKECLNKPLSEVQSKIQGYIDTFLEKRAEDKAKAAEEDKNRKDGKDLLDALDGKKTEEPSIDKPRQNEPRLRFPINILPGSDDPARPEPLPNSVQRRILDFFKD